MKGKPKFSHRQKIGAKNNVGKLPVRERKQLDPGGNKYKTVVSTLLSNIRFCLARPLSTIIQRLLRLWLYNVTSLSPLSCTNPVNY